MSNLDLSVRDFLARVAAPSPTATGGGVGAVSTASAAGLVAMTARLSTVLDDSAELVAEAERLQALAVELVDEDERSYGTVLAAQRRPAEDPDRSQELREALRGAARPPLRLARAGAEVSALAADLAERTKRSLRGDAVTACALAAASARSAAALARGNVRAAAKLDEPDGSGLESLAPSVEEEVDVVEQIAERAQRTADSLLGR